MPRIALDIASGSYESEIIPLSAQRCINWIPIIPQEQSLNQKALLGTPGLVSKLRTGSDSNRGAQKMGQTPYFVNGNTLYSISPSFTATALGTIEGTGRVSMANNGTKLCIVVPGGRAYVYETSLTQITDEDYRPSDTVVFKDGYFVFTASDGSVFFNSELNDPSDIDPLDFGTAEIDPDKIVAAHTNHNELFILGEDTIELFQNVGGSGFPFQRIPGANIEKGCHAKSSVVNFDNSFLFVGGGKNEKSAIWRATGSASAIKISTSAIDNEIQKFTKSEISDCFAMTYSSGGNTFAVFTFESTRIPSRTFVYDATSSALSGRHMWHERQSGITENRWRVNSIIEAYGELMVGDSFDGKIGIIDKDTRTEYGNLIFRQKASMPFSNNGLSHFLGEIELTMESGVGLTSGQGSDPIIRMDFSDDGARTWSSEFQRKIGRKGDYGHRIIWRRQGRIPAHRVVRFTMTDPVKANIIKLEANAESGVQ